MLSGSIPEQGVSFLLFKSTLCLSGVFYSLHLPPFLVTLISKCFSFPCKWGLLFHCHLLICRGGQCVLWCAIFSSWNSDFGHLCPFTLRPPRCLSFLDDLYFWSYGISSPRGDSGPIPEVSDLFSISPHSGKTPLCLRVWAHHCDGDQDVLPTNMAQWQTEYIKLASEKMAEVGRSHWPSHAPPWVPETGHETLMWQVPSSGRYPEKGTICISKDQGRAVRMLTKRPRCDTAYYTNVTSSACCIPLWPSAPHQTQHEHSQHFSRSSLPYEGSSVTLNAY